MFSFGQKNRPKRSSSDTNASKDVHDVMKRESETSICTVDTDIMFPPSAAANDSLSAGGSNQQPFESRRQRMRRSNMSNCSTSDSTDAAASKPNRRGLVSRSVSLKSLQRSRSLGDRRGSLSRRSSLRGLMGNMRKINLDQDEDSEQSIQQQEEFLLDKLGGMAALSSICHDFELRVLADESLAIFFEGVDSRIISAHQKTLFAMAFTRIPDDSTLELIRQRHRLLFAKGLKETHFDSILQHLIDALQARSFNINIVKEVMGAIAPLRPIFREEAWVAASQTDQRRGLERKVATAA
jgi:hemoglobin